MTDTTMTDDERIRDGAARGEAWLCEHAGDIERLPGHMHESVREYVLFGRLVGGFLIGVFSNDLVEAFARADPHNELAMRQWATFLYNAVPSECWGSRDRVQQWIKQGGLFGAPPKE